jgi:hypothetical protein
MIDFLSKILQPLQWAVHLTMNFTSVVWQSKLAIVAIVPKITEKIIMQNLNIEDTPR